MKTFRWLLLAVIFTSCHLPSADKKYSDAAKNTYKLQLHPLIGSSYHYDLKNSTEMEIEVNGSKVESSSKTLAGVTYSINKDSSGSYLFNMKYDQLHLNLKSGDTESELDADRGKLSSNPAERMLGLLKDANLTAVVTPIGDVKEIQGYKDLSIQLLSTLDPNDLNARQIAQKQLDKQVGGEMLRNTMKQLFKIFPDSAVRLGDKWKIESKQEGQLVTDTKSYFKLTDINNEMAFITSKSDILSNEDPIDLMGQSVTANLKGAQEGKFEIEAKTGMLINGESESEISGLLKMQGQEIPVKVRISVKLTGKKLK